MAEGKPTFLMVDGEPLIMHARVYDRQKAHEYYMRRRHLKGRQKGSGQQPSGRQAGVHHTPKKSAKQLRKEADARVAALEKRLDRLREVLRELVKQAKAKSGVETKSTTPTKKAAASGGGSKKTEHLTAKQKKDAAERSAEYRKNHPEKKAPEKDVKELRSDIEEVQAKIKKIRAELQAASKQARSHSQTQTAPKGR